MASYTIKVPDAKIKELKSKLSAAIFPDEASLIQDSGWDYGVPLSDLKRLAKAWETFDWRASEAELNNLPNFHRPIQVPGFDELDVHYVHQKSDDPEAVPLLFVHGWPGSYIEVGKLLPELKKKANGVSFNVVAPSLPNFGWSQGVKTRGFALKQYAETCHQLMLSLGYKQYVTQGGDWGFFITRALGALHPEACLASHINMLRSSAPTWTNHPWLALQHSITPYTTRDKQGFRRSKWFAEEGRGYHLEQSTKPQTIGYALQDSPVALLAWIYEKLHDWTDNYPWTDHEILKWISIYWFSTAGPAAAQRIYYEVNHTTPETGFTRERIGSWIPTVKLGMMRSPREVGVFPWTWNRTLGPAVLETDLEHGGHFAATENPDAVVKDLRTMFGSGGPCYRIVKS